MNKLSRLNYNENAIRIYQKNLQESISQKNDFNIYLNLGNLLHWIIMTEEWHGKNKNSIYYKNRREYGMSDIMMSIRFANNSMKHNMIFTRMHAISLTTMSGEDAICGTFSTGSGDIYWSEIKGFKSTNKRKIEQYECYNKIFKCNEITYFLNRAIKFLVKQNCVN